MRTWIQASYAAYCAILSFRRSRARAASTRRSGEQFPRGLRGWRKADATPLAGARRRRSFARSKPREQGSGSRRPSEFITHIYRQSYYFLTRHAQSNLRRARRRLRAACERSRNNRLGLTTVFPEPPTISHLLCIPSGKFDVDEARRERPETIQLIAPGPRHAPGALGAEWRPRSAPTRPLSSTFTLIFTLLSS